MCFIFPQSFFVKPFLAFRGCCAATMSIEWNSQNFCSKFVEIFELEIGLSTTEEERNRRKRVSRCWRYVGHTVFHAFDAAERSHDSRNSFELKKYMNIMNKRVHLLYIIVNFILNKQFDVLRELNVSVHDDVWWVSIILSHRIYCMYI